MMMRKLRAVAILCFLGCALSFSLAIYLELLTKTTTVPIDTLVAAKLDRGELETKIGALRNVEKVIFRGEAVEVVQDQFRDPPKCALVLVSICLFGAGLFLLLSL